MSIVAHLKYHPMVEDDGTRHPEAMRIAVEQEPGGHMAIIHTATGHTVGAMAADTPPDVIEKCAVDMLDGLIDRLGVPLVMAAIYAPQHSLRRGTRRYRCLCCARIQWITTNHTGIVHAPCEGCSWRGNHDEDPARCFTALEKNRPLEFYPDREVYARA